MDDIANLIRASARGRESIVATDAEFGRYRWLVRGEAMRVRFTLPLTSLSSVDLRLNAWSAFIEGRYRITPRWSLAGRYDRLAFGAAAADATTPRSWDAPVCRIEATVGVRMLRSMDLRVGWQQNWRDGGRVRNHGFPTGQVIYWF